MRRLDILFVFLSRPEDTLNVADKYWLLPY